MTTGLPPSSSCPPSSWRIFFPSIMQTFFPCEKPKDGPRRTLNCTFKTFYIHMVWICRITGNFFPFLEKFRQCFLNSKIKLRESLPSSSTSRRPHAAMNIGAAPLRSAQVPWYMQKEDFTHFKSALLLFSPFLGREGGRGMSQRGEKRATRDDEFKRSKGSFAKEKGL